MARCGQQYAVTLIEDGLSFKGRGQPASRAAPNSEDMPRAAVSASQPSISGSRFRTSIHRLKKQTLAHPKRRNCYLLDAQAFNERLKYDGGIGKGFDPLLGKALHAVQRSTRLTSHELRDVERVGTAHFILVGHMQRVVGQRHLEERKIAPRAAHRMEVSGGEALRVRCQRVFDDAAGAVGIELTWRSQSEGAKREGRALFRRTGVQTYKFQARAAKIADDALRIRLAGNDAKGCISCFFFTRKHTHAETRLVSYPLKEGWPISSLRTAAVAAAARPLRASHPTGPGSGGLR